MASKANKQSKYSEEEALYVGRLVYDVLLYTLTKCGLPETRLPSTDCKEIVYNRDNIIEVAGASVLRVSLIMRDKWKRMFISRLNSRGFSDEDVLYFLTQLTLCCPLSRRRITQSMVELFLALYNEIMLFFHHENVNIDFNLLLKSVSVYIIGLLDLNQDSSETMEDLFDKFNDISEYTRWITDFITDFAVPYGSRDDVSDNFFKYVEKQYKDELKKLRDSLGFLPHDLFAAITTGESVHLIENLAWESDLSDCESSEPPILPPRSGSGAQKKQEPCGRRSTCSTNVSEQTSMCGQSSSEMGPEKIIGPSILPASSGSGTLEEQEPRGRWSTCSANVSEQTYIHGQSSFEMGPENIIGPSILPASSGSGVQEEQEPCGRWSTCSTNVSEQTSIRGQSSSEMGLENIMGPSILPASSGSSTLEQESLGRWSIPLTKSSEMALEDNLRKMSLDAEGASLVSLGKIPKQKTPKKDQRKGS